jgi:hypothetical protein
LVCTLYIHPSQLAIPRLGASTREPC